MDAPLNFRHLIKRGPVIEKRINQVQGTGGRKDNLLPHGRVIGFSWHVGCLYITALRAAQ